MTDLGDAAVVQRLSLRRRIRAVDATTVQEQGGAGTDWRVLELYRVRWQSGLDSGQAALWPADREIDAPSRVLFPLGILLVCHRAIGASSLKRAMR
jgi:hypothetical protein